MFNQTKIKQFLKALLVLPCAFLLVQCASTKKATIPVGWNYSINWEYMNSINVTPSDHILIQGKKDMILLDGKTGRIIMKDKADRGGGLWGAIKRDIVEDFNTELLKSKRIDEKYFYKELAEMNTLILFNNLAANDEVKSINLKTGETQWSSTDFVWNLDEEQDVVNFFIHELAGNMGADITNALFFETRVQKMVEGMPELNAFLFRSLEKLYLVDNSTGKIKWVNNSINGTEIVFATYLSENEQILSVSGLGNVNDSFFKENANKSFKQITLLDARNGNVIWQNAYEVTETMLKEMFYDNKFVYLTYYGGAMEVFNKETGKQLFNTRDFAVGGTKISELTGSSALLTAKTAIPKVEGNFIYFINPSKVEIIGWPDKTLAKYNFVTGKAVWKKVFTANKDVPDLMLSDKQVIVRILGNDQEGIYAYSKKTGELNWKIPHPDNDFTNIIQEEKTGWSASGNRIYKIDLKTGEVLADSLISNGDIKAKHIEKISGDNIAVVGADRVAVVNKSTLVTVAANDYEGMLRGYRMNGQHLTLLTAKIFNDYPFVHVYDLNPLKSLTYFTLPKAGSAGGNIMTYPSDDTEPPYGYHITSDYRQIITVTESGLKAYEVY